MNSQTASWSTHNMHSGQHEESTHFLIMRYALWLFGFLGSHRFYYGKPITGTIWFLTLGLLLVGWVVDLFLMSALQRSAEMRYVSGEVNHTAAWLLLTFLGIFGAHRFYLGKWITGLLYAVSGGLLGIGVLYNFWTLNSQANDVNQR